MNIADVADGFQLPWSSRRLLVASKMPSAIPLICWEARNCGQCVFLCSIVFFLYALWIAASASPVSSTAQ